MLRMVLRFHTCKRTTTAQESSSGMPKGEALS